jgi:hypothetical protein
LFEIFSLEFMALIVGVACVAGGISISLAQRSQKPRVTTDTNSGEIGAQKTVEPESNNFWAFNEALTLPGKTKEASQEVETLSPSAPTAMINTYQAETAANQTPDSSLSDAIDSATKVSIPEKETLDFGPPSETFQSEWIQKESPEAQAPFEYPAPLTSLESQAASYPLRTDESSSSTETTVPLALPTDSVALQNISHIPVPTGVQGATSNAFSYSAGNSSDATMHAYCVKCKSKKQIRDPRAVTMKNGRPAISGICNDCGTRVFRIGRFPTS